VPVELSHELAAVLVPEVEGDVSRVELELTGRTGYNDQATSAMSSGRSRGRTPTRYLDVRRRFLREHAGHPLDVWPLPAD
jgi:hypothetical protein